MHIFGGQNKIFVQKPTEKPVTSIKNEKKERKLTGSHPEVNL